MNKINRMTSDPAGVFCVMCSSPLFWDCYRFVAGESLRGGHDFEAE